jgi:hypothetical protein
MLVEGVKYEVNWKAFRRGASIFIPCLDPPRAKEQVREVVNRLRYKVLIRVVIYEGIRGLRIWRQ